MVCQTGNGFLHPQIPCNSSQGIPQIATCKQPCLESYWCYSCSHGEGSWVFLHTSVHKRPLLVDCSRNSTWSSGRAFLVMVPSKGHQKWNSWDKPASRDTCLSQAWVGKTLPSVAFTFKQSASSGWGWGRTNKHFVFVCHAASNAYDFISNCWEPGLI